MTDYVYILGFTDGIVKVGRTQKPASRIGHHKYAAMMRNAKLNGSWVGKTSIPQDAERALIAIGRHRFTRAWGLEYFRADHQSFMSAVLRDMHRWDIHIEGKSVEHSPFPRQFDPQFDLRRLNSDLGLPAGYLKDLNGRPGEFETDRYGRLAMSAFTHWLKAKAMQAA